MADENGNDSADENGNGSTEGGNFGTIQSITGVVVDALFTDELPEIYSALEIDRPGGRRGKDRLRGPAAPR